MGGQSSEMGQQTHLGAKLPYGNCLDPSHLFLGFNWIFSEVVPDSQPYFCVCQIENLTKDPCPSFLGFPLICSSFTFDTCSFPSAPFLSLLQDFTAFFFFFFLWTEGKDKIKWKFPATERETLPLSTTGMVLNTHPRKVKADTEPSCQDPWGTSNYITRAFRNQSVRGIIEHSLGWEQTSEGVACLTLFLVLQHLRLLCFYL